MVFEFKLPDIGEGVHEGEIVAWAVKEGDEVEEDQKIVEVMTDKATVEITSPRTGTIQKILVQDGEVAKVGDVIVQIATGDGGGAAAPAPAEEKKEEAPKAEDEDKTLFDLETDASSMWRSKRAKARPDAQQSRTQEAHMPSAAEAGAKPAGGKVLAAPAIRREAREKGVDLSQVAGSGPAGRITRQDWNSFIAAGGRAPSPAPAAGGPAGVAAPAVDEWPNEERIALKGLRKAIHSNMRQSEDYAVPFTYWDEFDVTELVKLRKDAKATAEEQGVKLTYLPFIVKAVVSGLKQFPDLNAHVEEDSNTLVRRNQYNIGIATATDRGLMVVVVKDADRKSIFEISRDIAELSEKAREGKASREELTGSTFTITSLGREGGLGATPVINHPESAILGVHKLEPRAKVNADREVVVRDCMNLTGTFDHRWIDGHVGAAFMQHVGKLLENPQVLLLA